MGFGMGYALPHQYHAPSALPCTLSGWVGTTTAQAQAQAAPWPERWVTESGEVSTPHLVPPKKNMVSGRIAGMC